MFGTKSKPANQNSMKAPGAAAAAMAENPAVPPAPAAAPAPMKNMIAQGTVVEGNIVTDGDLQLEGTVKGDIHTNSKLVVGNDAFVEGNIYAAQADVAGRITGTVECSGLLMIKASCIINGDIITKSLNVESGSTFDGRCQVGKASRNMPADKKDAPHGARHAEMPGKSKMSSMAGDPACVSSALL